MKGTRPVFWHEGLFLQPHHFQLQDQFHNQQRWKLAQAVCPYPWGVLQLKINKEGLSVGTFEVTALDMIFPDGTWVNFPQNASLSPLILKEQESEEAISSIPVYIGLPRWSDTKSNVTALGAGGSLNGLLPVKASARFQVNDIAEPVRDIFTGIQETQVRFLEYQLRLFSAQELEEAVDYQLVQLALLVPEAEGYRLSDRFIPPVVWTGSSSVLKSLMEEIRDRLTAKGQDLSGYKATRLSKGAPGGQDLMLIQALQCVSRHIPIWHHLAESNRIHPFEAYLYLRALVGELSTFVTDADPLGGTGDSDPLPPYNHTDIGGCFHKALSRMVSFLDGLSAGPEYIIDLLFDGTYFTSDLAPSLFEGRARFYLVLESEVGKSLLNQLMGTTAKVAAREHMPLLIARALPGLRVLPLPEPPPALPKRPDAAYFELDTSDIEPWQKIRDGSNIAIYFDSPMPDLKAQLMVVYES